MEDNIRPCAICDLAVVVDGYENIVLCADCHRIVLKYLELVKEIEERSKREDTY